MNGALFDFFGTYRPLFLMMATYTALAFVAVLAVPRGAGEAAPVRDTAGRQVPGIISGEGAVS